MKKKLLVYGAGAIGRGYLPWVFSPSSYAFYFVEANESLRASLRAKKRFITYCSKNGAYEPLDVSVEGCCAPGEELAWLSEADAVITAVGPRNFLALRDRFHLGNFKNREVPVICCENDAQLPKVMEELTGNPNIFFAIPDVITSNTAPDHLLAKDPLSITTEDGICFIDDRAKQIGGVVRYVPADELNRQWLAKLYIHNTPHCIAAYLGSLLKVTYLHESMKSPLAAKIVEGAMHEMEEMLLKEYNLDPEFVRWYGGKELARFRNELLCDPISRVAREPFRKLKPNDRLIGAAQLCLAAGVVPKNLMIGIMAAFVYENPGDPDFNIVHLIRALNPRDFLKIIIRLREGEALFQMLLDRWEENRRLLGEIRS